MIFILSIHEDIQTPEHSIWKYVEKIRKLISRAINISNINIEYKIEFIHISNIDRVFEFEKKAIPFDLVIDIKSIGYYSQMEVEGVFVNKGEIDSAIDIYNSQIEKLKRSENLVMLAKNLDSYVKEIETFDESQWSNFFKLKAK